MTRWDFSYLILFWREVAKAELDGGGGGGGDGGGGGGGGGGLDGGRAGWRLGWRCGGVEAGVEAELGCFLGSETLEVVSNNSGGQNTRLLSPESACQVHAREPFHRCRELRDACCSSG